MNENNKIYFISSIIGITEHYSGQIPRALLDFKQLDNKLSYKNIFNHIYNRNGLISFYPSNVIQLTSISLAHIWLFHFYELNKQENNTYKNLFYGSISRVGHDLLILPGEYIRLQCNLSGQSSSVVIKNIFKQSSENYKNTTKILKIVSPLNILINIPGNILDFYVIKYLTNKYGNESYKIYSYGFLAGIFSTIVTNPFDIIKTNLLSYNSKNYITNEKYNYKPIYKIIDNIYSKNGIKGFYNGIFMRSFQTSICYGTYELLNKYI